MDGQLHQPMVFGPHHIAHTRMTYVHPGDYEPTIERIPLSVTIPSITEEARLRRSRRQAYPLRFDTTSPYGYNRRYPGAPAAVAVEPDWKIRRRQRRGRKNRNWPYRRRRIRQTEKTPPDFQLELAIRIVRLYHMVSEKLKSPTSTPKDAIVEVGTQLENSSSLHSTVYTRITLIRIGIFK